MAKVKRVLSRMADWLRVPTCTRCGVSATVHADVTCEGFTL